MAQFWLFDVTNYPGEMSPGAYDSELGATVLNGHLDEWERADELGFDGIYLAEHHFTAYNLTPSPNVLLAAIAQRTQRMRFGTMCNVLPFTQPLRIAEEFAMLDAISHGRVEVGLGRGVDEQEFVRYGIALDDARPMFLEGFELIMKAWTQDTFTHEGRFYPLVGECSIYPRPVQQPHPPLWITAVSPPTVEWAAERGIAITSGFAQAQDIAKKFQHYREVAETFGHSPAASQFGLFRHVFVADTDREARSLCEPALNRYFQLFAPAALPKDLEKMAVGDYAYYKEAFASFFSDRQPTFEEICDSGFIICGDPRSVRDQILEQLEVTGAGRLLAQVHFGDLALDRVMHAEELLATEVLPAVRELQSELVG
ncbi:MAG TPA: LLM class flavin-dependent oxidoreductase [Solirubrobacteraceae bacterium]|nr:LLM class flavin-dependent oxidoreductase [Solirubrobacteraceae bacterium]